MTQIDRTVTPRTRNLSHKLFPHCRELTALFALLCGSLAACSAEQESPAQTPTPAQGQAEAPAPQAKTEPAARATSTALNNAAYESEFAADGRAQLMGGIYRQPGAGGTGRVVISMHRIAWGDLDGDGDPDAVVVIKEEPGTDQVWYTLHAVLNENGTSRDAANTRLGQLHVNRVAVGAGMVVAYLATHSEGGKPDSSGEVTERRFQFSEGKLEPVGES